MLVLEEKGLSGYESKFIEFSKNQHKSDEILKWNPRGQVPTMIYDNDFAINESFAACEFLEKVYAKQGTQLTPDDPKQLALMLQRKCEVFSINEKTSEVIHYNFHKQGCVDGVVDPVKAKKLLDDFFTELARWESYAAKTDYIAGNKLTLADLCFFPNLAIQVRYRLDLAKHAPSLATYYDRMKQLPSVQKTWPPHWKETPNPQFVWE
jgi:glutathione S-transferase